MTINFILQLLPRPGFLIFISTFAGALAGEFYREANDKKEYKFHVFLSKFFASWMIGFATTLLLQSTFGIGKNEILIAASIVFGFNGHKKTIDVARKLMDTNFKSEQH